MEYGVLAAARRHDRAVKQREDGIDVERRRMRCLLI
jgi:hypothetical protein